MVQNLSVLFVCSSCWVFIRAGAAASVMPSTMPCIFSSVSLFITISSEYRQWQELHIRSSILLINRNKTRFMDQQQMLMMLPDLQPDELMVVQNLTKEMT